ncbi:MAG: peptide deformylase [Thermodesulfovibrionales bacterium]|jgi:peptide deformylase
MALLEIKTYPETVLAKRAAPVNDIDGDVELLIDDMIETMYSAPGIGLAAPQVGVSKRLIVVDVSVRDGEKIPLIVLINPEIVHSQGEIESEEGCLSLPGFTATVIRAEKVLVKGMDREGSPMEIEGEGLLSRALQHEIDHLNGRLLIDRISRIKREFFRKRIQKALSKA